MEKNKAVEALEEAKQATEKAQAQTLEAVIQAVQQGVSWAQIGAALGLSKQTAFARYGKQEAALAKWRKSMDKVYADDAASRMTDQDEAAAPSMTASIFSDDAAPATRAAEIHGQRTVEVFQQFAADRKAANVPVEDQERADFWEAKRKYVVTVDGAIYSPRGENGWDLHKVLRNVNGRNFQRSYSDMSELIAANEGLLYISRDKYKGLVQNAAADRECWIMAATKREYSVTASPELTEEIKAMADKLAAIDKKLKAKR